MKTETDILRQIVQKQDKYIQELSQSFENRNYGKRPEIMYECYRKYVHIISDLKKQLEECKESETHVIDEMDESPYKIIFNGRTYIRK